MKWDSEEARQLRSIYNGIDDRLQGGLPYGIYDRVDGAEALRSWILENDLRESGAPNSVDYILRGTATGMDVRRKIWEDLYNCEMDHPTIWHRNGKPAVLVGIPSSSMDSDREGMRLMRAIPDICISISDDEERYGWSRGRVAFIEFRRIGNFGHGPFCDCR